jgi:hypothetical protein
MRVNSRDLVLFLKSRSLAVLHLVYNAPDERRDHRKAPVNNGDTENTNLH